MANRAADLFKVLETLFPGADMYAVDVKESCSSDHGSAQRVEVMAHWLPEPNHPEDVSIFAGSVEEAEARLRAEVEIRAVKAKHGV